MNNLKTKLIILEQILTIKNVEALKYLKNAATENDLNNFLKEYKLEPNLYNDFSTLYFWHNGTNITNNPTGNFYLFPTFYLLSIDQIQTIIKYQNTFYSFKESNLIPIFSSGDDYISLKMVPENNSSTLYYSSISNVDVEELHTSIFDTIEKMIETIISCFENSVFRKKEEYIEIVDYHLYKKIAMLNNPLSVYWKNLNW